jgi:hypothetical protein
VPKTVTTYDDAELGLSPGWAEHLDPNIREELKQGRINRLEAAAALARAEAAERELTLYRAGIPAGDKRGQVFAEYYKGSGDPAEIKAEFEELFGPLDGGAVGGDAGAGGTGSQGAGTTGAAADKRIATAGAGGGAPQTPGTTDLRDALRNAKTTEEVKEIIRNAPPEAGIKLPDD